MSETKNIFISHVHEDDALLPKLKDLIGKSGMEVRDSSINSNKPNEAQNEDYIKNQILAPQINWASTLIVLVTHDTAQSEWVNWEIEYAAKNGKNIIAVYAQGATEADLPESFEKLGDAAIVGWNGDKIVDAINGNFGPWDSPDSDEERNPAWTLQRYSC